MKTEILLVEDDQSLARGLEYTLMNQGYKVRRATTLAEAVQTWDQTEPGLVLLDVGLPDGSGFDFCTRIRRSSAVPVIFLTACDEEVNVVMGLDMGGDDYITKPFRVNELISRIQAVLRRRTGHEALLTFPGNLLVDTGRRRVEKNGTPLALTSTEYRLLELLFEHQGAILPRDTILEHLWDSSDRFVDANTLSVYIRRLREKLEDDPGSPQYIETIRGMGYRWR